MSNIWSAFCLLSNRRNSGEYIGFGQIKDFKELTGTRLKPWEVRVIIELDETYMKVANK